MTSDLAEELSRLAMGDSLLFAEVVKQSLRVAVAVTNISGHSRSL